MVATRERARAICVGEPGVFELLHQYGRLREVYIRRGDQFPAQTTHVVSLKQSVFCELVLEAEVVVLRVGCAEVWIHYESKRHLGVKELSQAAACDEGKRINGALLERVKWVRDRIKSLCVTEVGQIRHISKGWLSSKLQVESSIFDVIEDPKTTAHDQLGISQHVPGKS